MQQLKTAHKGIVVTTRKQQVLDRLSLTLNRWVDGPELASERVGGSEGHRRIRELRAAGYQIEQRRHPDAERRGVFQYRLTEALPRGSEGLPTAEVNIPIWKIQWRCETCGSEPMERPLRTQGDFGIARCATCKSRRVFRSLAA